MSITMEHSAHEAAEIAELYSEAAAGLERAADKLDHRTEVAPKLLAAKATFETSARWYRNARAAAHGEKLRERYDRHAAAQIHEADRIRKRIAAGRPWNV